ARWGRPGRSRRTGRRLRRQDRRQRGSRGDDAVPAGAQAGGCVWSVHSGHDQREVERNSFRSRPADTANGINSVLRREREIMNVSEYKIKQDICEIGRRLYAKGFAAANDGNITYRLNDKQILCTPTMVSKGFLKPDDICKVDYDGKQIAGTRKRTSEVLLHLA